jgi:hypothetical protein
MTTTGWYALGAIISISSALNAVQVVIVDDTGTRLYRADISVGLLFIALLCVRRGIAERGD